MKNNYSVYVHILPNKKKYVGITSVGVNARARDGKGYKKNTAFYSDILLYGWDSVITLVLFEELSVSEATQKEKYYIKFWNTINEGYNISEGGVCATHTIETKEKLSAIAKARWDKGEDFGKRLGISDSSRRRMSIAKIGVGNNNYKKIYKYTIGGDYVCSYDTIADAGRSLGVYPNYSAICNVAKGKQKTAFGFKWSYEKQ